MEPIPNFLEVARRRPSAPLTRHGKEFWQQAVRDHETSGLSLSQFCQEHGLAKATFFKWRKALKQQSQCGLLAQQPETQSLPGILAVPLGPTHTSPATLSPQVPVQDLDADAVAAQKDKEMARKRVGVEQGLNQNGQGINGLAHVHRMLADPCAGI